MTAKKSRRSFTVRVNDPDILNYIESREESAQETLDLLIKVGAIINEAGAAEHLISLKKKGTVERIGALNALQMAVDFCKQESDMLEGFTPPTQPSPPAEKPAPASSEPVAAAPAQTAIVDDPPADNQKTAKKFGSPDRQNSFG